MRDVVSEDPHTRDLTQASHLLAKAPWQRFAVLGDSHAAGVREQTDGYPDRSWYDHIVAALGLQGRLHHTPAQLSGGQQQRVACARALLGRPEVIFADEPTGNLDSRTGEEVMALLEHLNRERGVALVIVTHDADVARRAKRQIAMRDGLVLSDEVAKRTAAPRKRVARGAG